MVNCSLVFQNGLQHGADRIPSSCDEDFDCSVSPNLIVSSTCDLTLLTWKAALLVLEQEDYASATIRYSMGTSPRQAFVDVDLKVRNMTWATSLCVLRRKAPVRA